MRTKRGDVSRRQLMKTALTAQAAALMWCASHPSQRPRAVELENSRTGTSDWMLTNTRIDPKTKYRCPWIEGYCSHTSIKAGDDISIFASTNPAAPFTLDIHRMGYYQGNGAILMLSVPPMQGKTQPDPPVGERRLRNCQWETSFTVQIPSTW